MEFEKACEEIENKIVQLLMDHNDSPEANRCLFPVYISVKLVNVDTGSLEYAEHLAEYLENHPDADYMDICTYWYDLVPKEVIEHSEHDESEDYEDEDGDE